VSKNILLYFLVHFLSFLGEKWRKIANNARNSVCNFGGLHKNFEIFSGFFTKMKKDLDKGGKEC